MPHVVSSCARSGEFPCWTWAGWKTTEEWMMWLTSCTILRLDSSGTEQIVRTHVSFTFQNSVLSYSDASEEILNLSDQGRIPNIMTIIGKVFDMKVECRGIKDPRGRSWKGSDLFTLGIIWTIDFPAFLTVFGQAGRSIHPPPGILEEKPWQTQDLTALLLTVRKQPGNLILKLLLLRPVEQGIDGFIYERVTSCEASIAQGKVLGWKDELQSESLLRESPLLQLRSMKVAIRKVMGNMEARAYFQDILYFHISFDFR